MLEAKITIAKMAFKKGFIHLLKLSLRKDFFQLSQGAYASFEFFLDSFILLFSVKLSSMVIPKNFIFSTLLITPLLRTSLVIHHLPYLIFFCGLQL